MSLINEALKKARQAQPQPAAQTAPTPALRPVDSSRHSDHATGIWLPILIAATLITSAVLLWQWFASGRVEVVRARSTPTPAIPLAAPAPSAPTPIIATAPAPVPRPLPIPPVAQDAKQDTTNAVAVTSEPPAPPASTNAPAIMEVPRAPTYKLQGIFYRPNNPSAVIDGKLVFAGSRVSDAHVLLIEKDAVTIVTSAGQTNLLELP